MKKQVARKSGIRRMIAIAATLALLIGLTPTALANGNVNAGNNAGVNAEMNVQDSRDRDRDRDRDDRHQPPKAQTFTIRASSGDGGTVNPGGETQVPAGQSQTYTIKAKDGFEIRDVSVDGSSVGKVETYTFKNVREKHTIKATFTATRAKEYTIRTSTGDGGSIVPGSPTVKAGGEVTLKIVPDRGYEIRDVSVDGSSVGAVSSYTFKNVTDNHTLKASFKAGRGGGDGRYDTYLIRTSAGDGGSINPGGDRRVDRGDSITFKITPQPGYEVRDVSVDGRSIGAVGSYTFKNVREDHTLKATFSRSGRDDDRGRNTYTITARAGDGGRISPSGSMSVRRNDSQTFTITPDRNYRIRDVVVDGRSMGAVSSFTFTKVSANHEIRATFERAVRNYSIVASAGDGGSINPSGGVLVERGRSQLFTMRPNSGYRVKDVVIDGRSIGAVDRYNFSDVDQDHSIKVTFEREKDKSELKITEAYVTSITKNSAKLVVSIRGSHGDFKYQWQVKSGSSYKNISGGKYASFTYNGLESGKTYTVRCVVTDARGNSVTSKALSFQTLKGSWGSSTGGVSSKHFPATGVITGGSVNIRRTASTALSPLATAHKGDKFQVVDWVSSSSLPYGFYKIRWGTTYAYVAANYMELR